MSLQTIREYVLALDFIVIILSFLINDLLAVSQSQNLLLFISVWNIIVFGVLLYHEFTKADDFHPFMLMLLASIQFVGFNGISVYHAISAGEHITFGIYDITNYLTKGALFVSLEHALLYLGFILADKYYTKSNTTILDSINETEADYYKWGINSYLFVWGLRLVGMVIPLSAITSVLVNIANQGQMLSLMFLLFAYYKTNDRRCLRIHWVIVAIEVLIVITSGMKEVIIQNLIPYIIYIFIQYKNGYGQINFRFITQLAIMGGFVVYFVFPYVSIYRQINWTEKRNASASEVMSEYVSYMTGESRYSQKSDDRSVDYMMERAGSIEQNTFPIMYAEKYGTKPKYLYYTLIAFVPRILWPDKPQTRLGLMIHSLANGKSNWEQIHSGSGVAFSIGFIGACYFSLGLWYALLMPFIMGYVITRFWQFYKERIGVSFVALWGVFAIVSVVNKDFEAFSDGGLAFCVWNTIYYLIIRFWRY